MELTDETILDLSSSTTTTTTITIKGKRTKRLRSLSSSSSSDLSGSATEEEEDMANCLILLAQGGIITTTTATTATTTATITEKSEKFTSKKTSEGIAGLCVYECKTCNKCFPSFQALGGHRASHKKPKILNIADEKKPVIDEESIVVKTVSVSTNVSNKPRVHECSICGSEFSSGQALGGHMRRHRPLNMPETSPEEKKERTLLSLDLNLPAPPEDGGTFPFVFSVSKLVDCHY